MTRLQYYLLVCYHAKDFRVIQVYTQITATQASGVSVTSYFALNILLVTPWKMAASKPTSQSVANTGDSDHRTELTLGSTADSSVIKTDFLVSRSFLHTHTTDNVHEQTLHHGRCVRVVGNAMEEPCSRRAAVWRTASNWPRHNSQTMKRTPQSARQQTIPSFSPLFQKAGGPDCYTSV